LLHAPIAFGSSTQRGFAHRRAPPSLDTARRLRAPVTDIVRRHESAARDHDGAATPALLQNWAMALQHELIAEPARRAAVYP